MYNHSKVAVDVQELQSEVVLDALLDAKGEVFQTARGRKAILLGQGALQQVKRRLSLYLEEGNDGILKLRG